VTVVTYAADGTASPAAGAHVTGPGVDATTGGDGKASVTFGQPGEIRLKADKAGSVRSAPETVAVSAPGVKAPPPVVEPDKVAPVGRILGIREGQRFKRRRAPRVLRGTVSADPSGLRAVKLRLTRSHGGRCWMYSGHSERFKARACGKRAWFRIGDRQDWSYLLPARLQPGRYVLDVTAIDRAGNRDAIARPRTRTVFFVR
jgi:hypothetical protein